MRLNVRRKTKKICNDYAVYYKGLRTIMFRQKKTRQFISLHDDDDDKHRFYAGDHRKMMFLFGATLSPCRQLTL